MGIFTMITANYGINYGKLRNTVNYGLFVLKVVKSQFGLIQTHASNKDSRKKPKVSGARHPETRLECLNSCLRVTNGTRRSFEPPTKGLQMRHFETWPGPMGQLRVVVAYPFCFESFQTIVP